MTLRLFRAENTRQISERLPSMLEDFSDKMPANKNARILLKPNLNSNLDALTGNTTDLRLIASLVDYFHNRGYNNIVIGDGSNSGFDRDEVDVIRRLRLDCLAERLGVEVEDFNNSEGVAVDLGNGLKPLVSRTCFDCDFFVNIPKIKTHSETAMSVSLKNLIGILVGRENKTMMHKDLIENIVRLNNQVKPHLHIVDGLIAMEGTGPSAGKPVRMNTIIVGDDAYVVDLLACRLTGFEFHEVPALKLAIENHYIDKDKIEEAQEIDVSDFIKIFDKPSPNFLASLMINPRFQKYFSKVRNAPVIKDIVNLQGTKKLLLALGLTQEVIVKKERQSQLKWSGEKCKECGKCADFCPLALDLPLSLKDVEKLNGNCIDCLYCYAVCPEHAIDVEGELGFYEEQLKRYGSYIREKL